MSLGTLLLAFLAPIVRPKLKPEKSDREKALEAERDRQYDENVALIARIAELERRLDVAHAMLAAFNRIDRRLEQRPAGPDFRPPDYAQMQHGQQLAAQQYQQGLANPLSQAQYNMQQAMNAQNFYGPGLAEMPGAMLEFCNCVPARHDMFLRRGLGD